MQVDIVGRVNHLRIPVTQPLIPLFECLVNSIEAIDDAGEPTGRIDVHVHRDTAQGLLHGPDAGNLAPISRIDVVDNGIGFNDDNFKDFFLADSTRKVTRGNKGIGRFSWLRFFDFAAIQSTYVTDSEWYLRRFQFKKTINGVEGESVEAPLEKKRLTKVELHQLKSEFARIFPRSLETIANKILDHLLVYFVTRACPRIVIHDESTGDLVDVSELFAKEAPTKSSDKRFTVKTQTFTAHILKMFSGANKHAVSYCANKREVKAARMSSFVPDLQTRLEDEHGQEFWLAAYLTGPYLDSHVNAERTDIGFLEEESLEFPDELTKEELDVAVTSVIQEYAAPYLEKLQREKRQAIETFVNNEAPEYKFILDQKYSSQLAKLPANASKEAIDVSLYTVKRHIEIAHRQKAREIKTTKIQSAADLQTYKAKYSEFVEQENELGRSALAKYVIHRRTILELLDESLKLQPDGSYSKEDLIHSILYPMRATSDETEFGKQNLWVIDERLAYHLFLASDRPISTFKVTNSISAAEPDLVIFNNPRAFSETKGAPFQSVVIIELKRPERNEYPEKDESPVDQVLRYVKKLKEGTVKDKDGKTMPGVERVPFYAYILCSITPRIKAIADNNDFIKMQDGLGYFKYHQNAGCYMEILSYEKMVDDAKKRNRVFFEELNIPLG